LLLLAVTAVEGRSAPWQKLTRKQVLSAIQGCPKSSSSMQSCLCRNGSIHKQQHLKQYCHLLTEAVQQLTASQHL
jgi:hypothetical protein